MPVNCGEIESTFPHRCAGYPIRLTHENESHSLMAETGGGVHWRVVLPDFAHCDHAGRAVRGCFQDGPGSGRLAGEPGALANLAIGPGKLLVDRPPIMGDRREPDTGGTDARRTR